MSKQKQKRFNPYTLAADVTDRLMRSWSSQGRSVSAPVAAPVAAAPAASSVPKGGPLSRMAALNYFDMPDRPENYGVASVRSRRPLRKATATRMRDDSSITVGGHRFRGGSSPARNRDAGSVPDPGSTTLRTARGGRVVENSSLENAMELARRIGDNNDRRNRVLRAMKAANWSEVGDDKKATGGYAELLKNAASLGGADLSDAERGTIAKFLGHLGSTARARNLAAETEYWTHVKSLKGPTSRMGAIETLLHGRKPQGIGVAPTGEDRYLAMVDAASRVGAAAAGAAGARGSGGRGYGTYRSPGIGTATLNATVTGSSGTVSGRETVKAQSTGGGYGYGAVSMGSSAGAGGAAFRHVLDTAVNSDPGGQVVGFDPFGAPLFTKDRRGGYEHTSATEKDYRRREYEWDRQVTKLLNDSIMTGGAGADYINNRRIMRALNNARFANTSRYLNAMNQVAELARLTGVAPETRSAPVAPEVQQGQAVAYSPEDRENVARSEEEKIARGVDPYEYNPEEANG